jgi:glycosyl-4,4'-diaponeurosporenoate acyltransferase
MWFEFSQLTIALLNCLGIPLVHLGAAWCCEQLDERHFIRPLPQAPRQPGRIYEKIFLIKRWKQLLPDGAPLFDGFPKKKLESTEPGYLRKFILETRRGEFSHWLQWIFISGFVVWNPFPANLIILLYAALSNLPCLLNLRYTRIRLIPVLLKQLEPSRSGAREKIE